MPVGAYWAFSISGFGDRRPKGEHDEAIHPQLCFVFCTDLRLSICDSHLVCRQEYIAGVAYVRSWTPVAH